MKTIFQQILKYKDILLTINAILVLYQSF